MTTTISGRAKNACGLTDQRPLLVLSAALIAALGATPPAQASDIVYTINQSGTSPIVPSGEDSPLAVTETGTITTDGTIGVLQASDIVSWNLTLTDKNDPAYDITLTTANSGISVFDGNGLSASATALSFNYSDAGADFGIQAFNPGFYSGFRYVCYSASAGACAAGDTIVPYEYNVDGVEVALTGTQNLNNPPPTSAPEIGSASAASALTLLFGMLTVLRGRGRER
jgi:hypothetical protein